MLLLISSSEKRWLWTQMGNYLFRHDIQSTSSEAKHVIFIRMREMARSRLKDDTGVGEGWPKPAHAEGLSPSSMILCRVFQPGGLHRAREMGTDKRPACKHAIGALSFRGRNGWYGQLAVTGNLPAPLSPVSCATCTGGLAWHLWERSTGYRCLLGTRDLEGVGSKGVRRCKCRPLLTESQMYHFC